LSVLYGDKFVARLDPKLDRTSNTLVINGYWLDEPAFGAALEKDWLISPASRAQPAPS
jgi:uncharacterized protein YcaQ